VIRVREHGTPVPRGISQSSNERYADLWISTALFSLNLRWVKPERRLIVNCHRKAVGPWRRIRELERRADSLEHEVLALEHALGQSNERYDRIRDTNAQLRETLTLYRNDARA
jgi:hypothetical protein